MTFNLHPPIKNNEALLSIEQFAVERREGRLSCEQVVDKCLERSLDPEGDGSRVFVQLWPESARDVGASIDKLFDRNYRLSPIAGAPISVKNLLDVEGQKTQAASRVLDGVAPATTDAEVVARLKRAGGVLVGSTNMTEFAYSVVGLNGSFGTPGNPWDASRIPGGSSSGAAVSVAAGMSLGAIGSDTVGSIRVPAALCGIVGFKPTGSRVPLTGSIPLSTSLDSIGPMANSVQDCAALFAVISGEPPQISQRGSIRGLRLAIPAGFLLEKLDQHVSRAFERACTILSAQGAVISEVDLPILADVHACAGNRIIQSFEAFEWHKQFLQSAGDLYDPPIRRRIETGGAIEPAAYATMLERRLEMVAAYNKSVASYDGLLLPTVAVIAPTFEEAAEREDEVRSLLLRNTAPFNFLDCCAISIPIQEIGKVPVGLMVVGRNNQDWRLLSMAGAIEEAMQLKGDK
ncbi:aspartyl-tRNA(Asn)/glutamyl-tRNA(Gln) amidotransferase subunit A [Bradyrhizobium sp. USDA 4461]